MVSPEILCPGFTAFSSVRREEGGGFLRTFDMARRIRLGERESSFKPSVVRDVEQRGSMVFIDVALLTEKEMQDFLASRPKSTRALKMEATTLPGQTGKEQSMYVLSLDGLTCSEIHAQRRMRIYTSLFLAQEDLLAQATKVLHAAHASNVFQSNWEKLVGKQPAGLRDTTGFRIIPSKAKLLEKADELAVASELRGATVLSTAQNEVTLIEDEPANNLSRRLTPKDKKTPAKRKPFKAPPTPPCSEGGISRAKSGSKRGRPETELVEEGPLDPTKLALQDVEPQLRPEAQALGTVPPCFIKFSIERMLNGEKMGNQLQGA